MSVRINVAFSLSDASENPSSAVDSLTNRLLVHQPPASLVELPSSRNALVFNRARGFGFPNRRQGWNRAGGIDPRV